jgi:hypothetical protein
MDNQAINKEQVFAAVNAGIALLDPEQEMLEVYRKHSGGLMVLRQLLLEIGNGNIALTQPDTVASVDTDGVVEAND